MFFFMDNFYIWDVSFNNIKFLVIDFFLKVVDGSVLEVFGLLELVEFFIFQKKDNENKGNEIVIVYFVKLSDGFNNLCFY